MPSGVYRSCASATCDHNATRRVLDLSVHHRRGHSLARVARHGSAQVCGDDANGLNGVELSDDDGAIDARNMNASSCERRKA